MITIHDVLEARRAAAGLPPADSVTGEDFARFKLAMFGGCQVCAASLAAYNAYPDRSGYWRCKECLSDGYETVTAFELDVHGVTYADGDRLPAIIYGQEMSGICYTDPCHDCGAQLGAYHERGCDMEECPRCHLQLLSCDCKLEDDES